MSGVNTPAHLLIGLAVCGRPRVPRSGRLALAGSVLPDASLYLLAGAALFALQIPAERVFGELYFSDAWQTVFAIDNSALLWGIALLAAVWYRVWPLAVFAGAGLLHVATDLPLHAGDGRPHFWPLSDWIYDSPLSYWDSAHHAGVIAPIEALACAIAAWVCARRYTNPWARGGIAALFLAELWVVRQWLLFF